MKSCITRRTTLLAGCGLFLSACSETYLGPIGESVRLLVAGSEDEPIPRARIDSITYATMSAKIGSGQRALVVLGGVDQKELSWFSANRVVFVTREGRLIRTAGLAANLKHTQLIDKDYLRTLNEEQSPTGSLRRLVDLAPPDRYGILITSSLESLGPSSIEISELQFNTQLFRETNKARDLDWSFENLFWVDPENGLIWKSVQYIHPDIPPLELELLKPLAV